MRWLAAFLIAIFSFPMVNACIDPFDGIELRENAVFCHGVYNFEKGINIIENGISLDCNNSILTGNGIGYGILIKNRQNIAVQNCSISNYEAGIYLENSTGIVVKGNYLSDNKFGIALQNSIGNDIDGNDFFDNVEDKMISNTTVQHGNSELIPPKKIVDKNAANKSPLEAYQVAAPPENKRWQYYLIYLGIFLAIALAFYLLYYKFYNERRKLK